MTPNLALSDGICAFTATSGFSLEKYTTTAANPMSTNTPAHIPTMSPMGRDDSVGGSVGTGVLTDSKTHIVTLPLPANKASAAMVAVVPEEVVDDNNRTGALTPIVYQTLEVPLTVGRLICTGSGVTEAL
jgi:hypothetical protein